MTFHNLTTLLLIICIPSCLFSQTLSQTIRGNITDLDTKQALIGAQIVILDQEPIIGTSTDADGNFRIDDIPIGRISLKVSYLGYSSKIISNLVINSGKEMILDVTLDESAERLDDVVIKAQTEKGRPVNEMALLSARSISPEETSRYAGGFNDPSRIMSNFAGITTTHDGGNDIIVRGNSPKYMQWRLEGIDITNPNHFGDQSGVGGAISTLNNNLLANSDFYSGAFSAEYGNVLAGVYDVKLRAGNNEKFESVFGFGLLGTDITFEGPLKQDYGGSFLVNYRYSTASLINELGLLGDISGVPKFQDAAFKLLLPSKKMGTFSIFGLAGKSNFLFEDVTPATWETPGTVGPNTREDYIKSAQLLNLGIVHSIPINKKSYLKTSLSYSTDEINDDVFEKSVIPYYDESGNFKADSTLSSIPNYQAQIKNSHIRSSIQYNNKLNAKHKLQIGTKYILSNLLNTQSHLDNTEIRETLVDFSEQVASLRNYISWKYMPSNSFTLVAGVHNMNVLLNHKSTIEPRLALQWHLNESSSIKAGYGQHSQMESIQHYFSEFTNADGSTYMPNQDLDLLKSKHYTLSYEQKIGRQLRATVEVYYQDLYNLPVENNPTSHFSTINEGLEFNYVPLVNEGKGRNYGLELTIEKFFHNHFYYIVNGSIYESKYTALDGIERNTKYNGNYLINILAGKEIQHLGRKQNQTLSINVKAFLGGGKKITPLLRDANGIIAVNTTTNDYWDYDNAYSQTLQDIHLIVLSFSYKWNRPKATHELFLNLDNVTNTKGKISEFYDDREPNNVGHVTQFGIFPNLMYRVYF